jgi:anti-anti-sigma factor
MEPRILIAHKGTQGFVRIEIAGTFENASAFKAVCLDMLAKGTKEIIVDLEACERLDSSFCGILLGVALRTKEQRQTSVYIFNAKDELKTLCRNLGLDRLVQFKDDRPVK